MGIILDILVYVGAILMTMINIAVIRYVLKTVMPTIPGFIRRYLAPGFFLAGFFAAITAYLAWASNAMMNAAVTGAFFAGIVGLLLGFLGAAHPRIPDLAKTFGMFFQGKNDVIFFFVTSFVIVVSTILFSIFVYWSSASVFQFLFRAFQFILKPVPVPLPP